MQSPGIYKIKTIKKMIDNVGHIAYDTRMKHTALLRQLRKLTTSSFCGIVASLFAEEPDFVGDSAAINKACTPEQLLKEFGLEDETEIYGLKLDMTANEKVIQVLKHSPSWGEFVGAAVASFVHWNKKDRKAIFPQLEKTVRRCACEGVDH
jgi:hypothetical protein